MPRTSPIVGECVDFPSSQPSPEATDTRSRIRAPASILGLGLSAHGMPNHTYGYVLRPFYPNHSLAYHTSYVDIKADNIMLGIEDDSVFSDFENDELETPSPGKEIDGRTIYVSRELRMPKEWGAPVLCDFGSAVPGNMEHSEDIQPDFYRAPEVILEAPWTYSVDIWNVGCMVRQ